MLWSRSATDWGPWATSRWVRRRLLGVVAGDIVLMHDARRRLNRPRSTLRALEEVLDAWRARGIRFGPPSREWLRAGVPCPPGT